MSLHFLGIRDFPVLHSQLSSPSSKLFQSPDPSTELAQELAQDSKDVLIQRLHDLTSQLSAADSLKNEDITALHVDLDRMERVLHHTPAMHHEEAFRAHRRINSMESLRSNDDDIFWAPLSPRLASPRLKSGFKLQEFSHKVAETPAKATDHISPRQAVLLAQEADSLYKHLETIVKELKARKDEANVSSASSRFPDSGLTECSISTISLLYELRHPHSELSNSKRELQICKSKFPFTTCAVTKYFARDTDFETNQSELSFLRLQLRAIEVQSLEYIKANTDEELSQSINQWKKDWKDVDQRTKALRRKCKASDSMSEDSRAIVDAV
jgi:hypothetical protein